MGRQHRQFVETPTDRLKEAMDVVEIVAERPCELKFKLGCLRVGEACLTCRARFLVEREEQVQSSLRDVQRARKREAR